MNSQNDYREFSPYANFISAIFTSAILQKFPKLFGLWVFRAIHFITAIFIIGKCDCGAKSLPNVILFAIYFVTAIIR